MAKAYWITCYRAINNPDLSPDFPEYAIHFPSGDHSAFPDGSSPALMQIVLSSAMVMIHSCPKGRFGESLRLIVYAIFDPSGESCTAPTERSLKRSDDCKPAGSATAQ